VVDAATLGTNILATPLEVAGGSAIGGGLGYAAGSVAEWIAGGATSAANESHSNPLTGEPGTEVTCRNKKGEKKQTRRYGEYGFPDTDTDWDHSHGGLGKPHVHDWGRLADGSPPENADRGPGRVPQPGDPGF